MKNKLLSAAIQLLFGILAAYGGVLHFSMNVSAWKSPFLSSLYETGYLWQLIGIINLVAGFLLIINRYTLLSLLVLLPVTVNILLFHIFFFTTEGLFVGIPMFVLNIWCMWQYRSHFNQLLQSSVPRG
jgi:hypothetical protein